jgi:hypothetical protein
MEKESRKQETEDKTQQKGDSIKPEKLKTSKGISRVSLALACGVMFAFLAAWAGLFGNLGHRFWIFASAMMMMASAVLAFGLRCDLRNHHWEKWKYNGVAWIMVLVGGILGCLVIVRELRHNEAGPHLKLILNTSDSPRVNLELTNTFLQFRKPPVFANTSPPADLIIPASSLDRSPILRFTVVNDSELEASDTTIVFRLGTDIQFDAGPGWTEYVTREESKVRSVGWRINPIYRGNGEAIGDLTIKPSKADIAVGCPCVIQIMPHDRSDTFIAFWLAIPITTNLTIPCIMRPTNGVFHLPFSN